jgi:hypothetical protein
MILLLLIGVLVPSVAAQEQTVEELLDVYYAALQAAADGDPANWLALFAEDATMSVPALAPVPVTGKDVIQAAMWPGIYSEIGGTTVTVHLTEVDGNTATVYIDYSGLPVQDIFEFNEDGLIQSLTVNVGVSPPEASASAEPTQLPETGGAVAGWWPGLLVLAGAAIAGLGRRLPSR